MSPRRGARADDEPARHRGFETWLTDDPSVSTPMLDQPDAFRRLARSLETPASEPLASKQIRRRTDMEIEL